MNITIEKAQMLIAGVLEQLEKDSNCQVTGLGLMEMEVTQFKHDGQHFAKWIKIDIHHPPVYEWHK